MPSYPTYSEFRDYVQAVGLSISELRHGSGSLDMACLLSEMGPNRFERYVGRLERDYRRGR